MGASLACPAWVRRVRALGPKMIAPHRGPVIEVEAVPEFLAWLEALSCGAELLDELVSPQS